MKLKTLVLSLAAASLTASAFAAAQVQQPSHQALEHALAGNSYQSSVTHTYFNGKTNGFWIGAFGLITGTYNTNYLLRHGTYLPQYLDQNEKAIASHGSLTYSLNNADLLFGYDSDHAGFFADLGYSDFADYSKTDSNVIGMHSTNIVAREAYATYQINNMFAVKAGKFITDYGHADPYQPLQTLASSVYSQQPEMGGEVVFATKNFHASAAGVSDDTAKVPQSSTHNGAKVNAIILNGEYDQHFNAGTLGVQVSFRNHGTMNLLTLLPATRELSDNWLVGTHFATNKYSITADIQHANVKYMTYQPWIYDAAFNYVLTNKASIGAYTDFIYNNQMYTADPTQMFALHWLLGFTGSYQINSHVTANAYVQRAQKTSNPNPSNAQNNITVMGALSFKV